MEILKSSAEKQIVEVENFVLILIIVEILKSQKCGEYLVKKPKDVLILIIVEILKSIMWNNVINTLRKS